MIVVQNVTETIYFKVFKKFVYSLEQTDQPANLIKNINIGAKNVLNGRAKTETVNEVSPGCH